MSEANGTSPVQDAQPEAGAPCEDCATGGEKIVAVVSVIVAVLIVAMAVDLLTGGKVSGAVRDARERTLP